MSTITNNKLTDETLKAWKTEAMISLGETPKDCRDYSHHEAILALVTELQERRKANSTPPAPVVPETLPCSVELKPGLIIGKGCKTETLLSALQRRYDYNAEIDAMTPEERAKHYANIEAFKAMLPQPAPVVPEDLRRSLEAVARLNNEMYHWTSCLSYNGSYVGEPEGLLKRNIREIEHIMDSCRAAMLNGGKS